MTVIQLPDWQAEALKAKAASPGLKLEDWLGNLAAMETPLSPQEAVARILELHRRVDPDPEGWTVHDYINHGRPPLMAALAIDSPVAAAWCSPDERTGYANSAVSQLVDLETRAEGL
jgi:hypothetical protein